MEDTIDIQFQEIKKKIKDNNIKYVYLNFVDMDGIIRTKGVLSAELLRTEHISVANGISINGSIIDGYKDDENWWLIIPILETFTIIKWGNEQNANTAFMLCNIKNCGIDSRKYVEKVIEYAKNIEVTPYCGLSLTYELSGLKENEGNDYYKLLPDSHFSEVNLNLLDAITATGFDVESFIAFGKCHNGIEFVPQTLLKSIDQIVLSKWIASSIVLKKDYDLKYTVPQENLYPIHISFWNSEHMRNMFYNPDDKYELSEYGYKFMAGVLANFDEICAIILGTSNKGIALQQKYKKSFSALNDNCILSTPLYFVEKDKKDRVGWSKRCIFRGITPETNLYLALGSVILAGIDGIHKGLKISDYNDPNYTSAKTTKLDKINKLRNNVLFNEVMGEKNINSICNKII